MKCETKPIRRVGPDPDGRSVRQRLVARCRSGNKPNLLPGGAGWDVARGARDGRRTCQTKPNLGGLGHLGDGASGRPIVQNKPNSSIADCAKQTQFRQREKRRQVLCGKEVMVNRTFDRPWQNKANWPLGRCRAGTPNPRGVEGQSCETNPIRRNELRQTNPISAAGEEEVSAWRERTYGELHTSQALAKQSQFPGIEAVGWWGDCGWCVATGDGIMAAKCPALRDGDPCRSGEWKGPRL